MLTHDRFDAHEETNRAYDRGGLHDERSQVKKPDNRDENSVEVEVADAGAHALDGGVPDVDARGEGITETGRNNGHAGVPEERRRCVIHVTDGPGYC